LSDRDNPSRPSSQCLDIPACEYVTVRVSELDTGMNVAGS
jgi:hypothetical protein